MTTRKKALTEANFGSRTAEDEVDDLQHYFVETEQWRRILSGDVDIVFGAKGAGKSALYSLLVAQKDQLRLGRRTIFLAAENPRGAPAFRDLTTAPPLSEEQFRGLWKLYFLSISSNYLRHHLVVSKTENEKASAVFEILEKNGLLVPNANLVTRLKAALDYLKKNLPSLEGKVTEPNSGLELSGKITFSALTEEQRGKGYSSIDTLIELLNSAYAMENITCWLALDRLDVAFSDSPELEGNALRALFRTYLDMSGLSNIKIKIFLRDDIWRKIIGPGFREASHVTRTISISWEPRTLLNLLVKRISANALICDCYGMHSEDIGANAQLQQELFYKFFPDQVDIGKRQPKTLDWILSRSADGSKRTAPRELIHLLNEIRSEQLKLYEIGHAEPAGEQLVDRAAIRAALPAVSKVRYEQTLCAEYPLLKPYLDKLEGEKTEQSPTSLSKLWKVPGEKAVEVADQLVEAGFFERRGSRETPTYWVPFLYRDALEMLQGAA
ncbi:P-loop ATPase, Sll1717 family [Polaromonas sp. JS666]|uniref:P-loop ATPase, Sll1717 family n=1 Tax=Polaromonas sp. (strain JS666 / ATCC BAA-500) TaxID=296591 RepID=UPI00088A0D1E|nr:hypothetical protein [Polaromonas sp. JS666]SDN87773.1 hypothetical protein SAMN05720382_10994 [Polaromonas sp. JS666]